MFLFNIVITALVTGPAETCIKWETSNEAGYQTLDLTKIGVKRKCFEKAIRRKKATLKIKPNLKKGFNGNLV